VQACGVGGSICLPCASNQACVSGKCTCNASSCSGCCEGDQCKTGTSTTACGKSGAPCKKCGTGESCAQGLCTTVCSSSTCTGCCASNLCKPGTELAACGKAGGACQSCTVGQTCESGTCNSPTTCNSATCPTGCCKNNLCQTGTSDLACGKGGQACAICPIEKICVSQKCALDPGWWWDVTLVRVEVDSGTSWDLAPTDPKPDVFVELSVGTQTKSSKVVYNSYTPLFNEYLLTDTAKNLTSTITIRVWDSDTGDPNDLIGECVDTFYDFELEDGSSKLYYCDVGTDLILVEFAFEAWYF
jgi:hypothetical protein